MAGFVVDDVSVHGDSGPILRHVTVEIPSFGITVLVGPSGSGKSTLLRLRKRLDEPSGGRITGTGQPIVDVDATVLRRRVGMVFQRPVLFEGTVLDNLCAVTDLTEAQARAALDRVRLSEIDLGREAATLSGGEAQRLCLARTLTTEPEMVLADEPTSAIDASPRDALEALAKDLCAHGTGFAWVTHDLDQMRRIADRVIVLIDGRIAAEGTATEVMASSDARVVRFLGGAA